MSTRIYSYKIVLPLTIALLGSACAASAGTVGVTDVEVAPYPYNTLHVESSSYVGNPIAGLILLGTTGGKIIPVFCVDLFHEINIGGHSPIPYVTGPVLTDSSGQYSGTGNPLSVLQEGAIQTLVDVGFEDYAKGAANLGDKLTALQGAIWAIEYGATVTSGNADIESLIGSDISFGNSNPASFSLGLYPVGEGQGFGTTQGFVTAGNVPEASSWAMMMLGFAGLGFAAFHRSPRREAVAG